MRIACVVLMMGMLTCFAAADIDFSNYHNPTQVGTEMSNLVSAYPGLASVSTIGTSVNGLPIKVIKISDNVATDEPDEGDVIFVAAHHAREWISVEMALYLAEHLLKNYATNASLKADMDNLEIWIVPIVNPDGVAYTWDPAGYRYWRKNRRNNMIGDIMTGAFGVDLNRNWGYQWGAASSDMWNDTYQGPWAFSEPETRAIRDLAQNVDNLKALITYHSFTELFLRPWAYTTADPPGESTLKSISDRSIALIAAVHGHTYSDSIWYTASGEATDYLWGEMRVAAFTPELRPATGGLSGFSPPPAQILPSNQENLPAALALVHDAGDREVWIKDYSGDTGAEPSAVWTGSGWSHAFWVSPDIWTVPATLNQGATVTMYVHIRNNTGASKSNVQVDVYWTDPRIVLEFPNPNATLIGSQTVTVPAAGLTITMPWTVPVGTNILGERHWCVGAVIKHATDMPLTTQAQRTSNIGIKNFNTTTVVEAGTLLVAATNFLDVASELVVHIDEESLPDGWRVFVPPQPRPKPRLRPTATERKARLLGVEGMLLEPGETVLLPVRVEYSDNVKPGVTVDVNVHAAVIPLVAGKREAVGNGYTYQVVAPK